MVDHPSKNICTKKLALLNECAALTRAYSRDVTSLQKIAAKALTDGVYARFKQTAEAARVESEKARIAFDRHVAEHGC